MFKSNFIYILFIFIFANISWIGARCSEETQTQARLIQEQLHAGNFNEWMTPSLRSANIPNANGSPLAPTNIDGRVWLDCGLTPKYRVLFWQRYFIFPTGEISPYDPRIGFRIVNAFDIPHLSTVYDFYILPGITRMAHDVNRIFEFGVRANTTYSIPKSRWDTGLLFEMNATLYGEASQRKQVWGFFAPWTSYKISSRFSTQHWFTFPVKYQQGSLAWDITGMPFVQNGIGFSASKSVWIGMFLNNYLLAAPTLQNTWTSLWLNFSFI